MNNGNIVGTAAGANALAASGSSSLSMDSVNECLYEIMEDYLNSILPGKVKTPKEIQNELLSRIDAEFDAINSIKGKNSKWRKPYGLEPFMIAHIIARVYHVKLIAFAGLNGDREYDALGIYQEKGPNTGIYDTSEHAFRVVIRKFNRALTMNEIKETISALRDEAERVAPCSEKNLIAVNNGIFDYDTKTLNAFTPDLVFTTKCPVDYNPFAQNPVIQQPDGTTWDIVSWMKELADPYPGMEELFWQILGASIRPNVSWDTAVWFYSETGNNGKGTLCVLIRALVGEENCASIPIDQFSKDFMLEPLLHASAVVVDENDVGGYVDKAGNFKAAITGDTISINRKFKQPISYKFHGVVIQCINSLPKIKDKSDSFFRRQLFVPFSHCFTGHENKAIKDVYMHRKDVLEFVLNKVLNMNYYQLIKPQACEDLEAEYREYNDPVEQFTKEMFPKFQWDLVPDEFLYDLFKKWYERNVPSGTKISKDTFIPQVVNLVAKFDGNEWVHCKRKKVNGKDIDERCRTDNRMAYPEPLIMEYDLENWKNPGYKKNSCDEDKICIPKWSKKYAGFKRTKITIDYLGHKISDPGNSSGNGGMHTDATNNNGKGY